MRAFSSNSHLRHIDRATSLTKVSTMTHVSRRTVTGLATAGLSLPLLAACGEEREAETGGGQSGDGAAGDLGHVRNLSQHSHRVDGSGV